MITINDIKDKRFSKDDFVFFWGTLTVKKIPLASNASVNGIRVHSS